MKITTLDKALAAFIVGLVGFVANLLQNGHWTSGDTISLVTWIVGPGLVYFANNKPTSGTTTAG